jgi:hypothetical protein
MLGKNVHKKPFLTVMVGAAMLAAPTFAVELTGSISAEGRFFGQSSQYAGQKNGSGVSLVVEPEFYHQTEDYADTFTFAPFMRLDPYDSDREHVDIRELNWLHVEDEWETKIGFGKVFWGVTESNHLVDIINQTDLVESPDGEDKLGQPMVQVSFFKDWGTVRLFALPYFRERTYPGKEGRLRTPNVIDTDNPVYESSMKQRHLDAAIRYEKTLGDWDIGLAHFSGTSREARLVVGTNAGGENVWIPHYDVIDQTSADVQLTKDAWLWKLESISRSGQGERFFAASGGVEYTFFDIKGSGKDIGLLAEYHRDDRGVNAPSTFLQDDIFLGTRLVMNDVPDTQLLAGVMFDRLTKARSYSVEASRRLSDTWKIEVEARAFAGHGNAGEAVLRTEDYAFIRLARYF